MKNITLREVGPHLIGLTHTHCLCVRFMSDTPFLSCFQNVWWRACLNYVVLLECSVTFALRGFIRLWCVILLLPRLPKLASQCYSNGPDNLYSNKEIQPSILQCGVTDTYAFKQVNIYIIQMPCHGNVTWEVWLFSSITCAYGLGTTRQYTYVDFVE